MADRAEADVEVAIVGSGFSGLGMAIALKRAGHDDFVILEQAEEVGGTWRDNTYPGCACDVQSHLYSFSFAPNPAWSRMFAPQAEIQAYLTQCADRYEVRPHIRFGAGVTRAVFDEARALWRIETSGGEHLLARVLVTGIGGLSRPAFPDIPGRERFQGRAFHSQRWAHDHDLSGRQVAVIGTGASGIQIVPQIAGMAKRLHVFQRTPPWILPKPDREISPFERRLYTRLPFIQKLYRAAIYWQLESRVVAFTTWPFILRLVERQARRHLRRQIDDRVLREALTPDYRLGCKRILMADDYYPALCRSNVDLITDRIREITETGIRTADGKLHEVDTIVWGTGFRATDPLPAGVLFGRGGRDLAEIWKDGAEAYKGTVVSGFPNLFMLTGPNTGLGHSSMVFMIESQIRYVMSALATLRTQRLGWAEVRPSVQARYNARLQKKLRGTVWSEGGCVSWYVDPRSGRNTTLWPGFTFRFRWETRRFDLRDYMTGGAGSASSGREEAAA